MANDNKKINQLVTDADDDPTAELEVLSEEARADMGADSQVERESDAKTFEFESLQDELGDADETILTLKADLKSRAESISKLQFDIEQLRARWMGLEKEIKVREEVTRNLTEELKIANRKQSNAEKLLKRRRNEIKSLKSRLSDKEESLTESARQIEEARTKEQELEARATGLQAELDAVQDKLRDLTKESRDERSKKRAARKQARSLSLEVDNLGKELAASRAAESELHQYVDRRKSEWDKQESELHHRDESIEQQTRELDNANALIRDSRDVQDELNVRLASLQAERDDLRKEITQLRKDAQIGDAERAAADKKLLASKEFEIGELKGQITRTETYADELRQQVQDQLSTTDELQTRQKLLEILLASANAETRELADCVEELRSTNANLVEEKGKLQKDFDKEVRQIRLDLGKAQETAADRESLYEQLTADLADTRNLNISLETRLSDKEEQSQATVAKLEKRLKKAERSNDELKYKLSNKDDAITAMLSELTKRSEAIQSIDEMEDVIQELDDRMSERIDEKSGVERGRITRLLVGNIDGQKLRFPLFKDRLTVGRTAQNDIQLKVAYISRRHAVIVTDENGTRIVDWGSKNGVYVNSIRVTDQLLRNGDLVTIGTADFKFEERPKR